MKKTLSISVASYNIEKYLDRLMDSIISADVFEDVEIIIVNDGSTDSTLDLAKKYETVYPGFVRVIDKENGGHGSTINTGIRVAEGKYFRALDGDDWLDSNNLKRFVLDLKDTDADLIVNSFYWCYEADGTQKEEKPDFPESGHKYQFIDICKDVSWLRYHMITYKTELLKENPPQLDEHCFYVDLEYVTLPIIHISDVIYFDYSVYCYRIGYSEQSVSPASRIKHVDDSYKVAKRIIAFYKDNTGLDDRLKDYIRISLRNICQWHLVTLVEQPYSRIHKKEVAEFYRLYYEVDPSIVELMVRNAPGKNWRFLFKNPVRNYVGFKIVAVLERILHYKN